MREFQHAWRPHCDNRVCLPLLRHSFRHACASRSTRMKRVAGTRRSGYGHSVEEEEDEGRGLHVLGLPPSGRSPAERAAHHAGTRASRQALIVLVVSCALIVLLRPMYGPYIDRFGVDGDQSVSSTLASRLESRASRHNLDTPRSWRDGGRGRGRPPPERDGDETSALTSRDHVRERSQWRSAIEALRGAPEEDRERVIHGLRRRGGGGGGGGDGGETRSRGRRGGGDE